MKIQKIIGRRNFGYKILQWQIVQGCNYKCPYCIVEAPQKPIQFCDNYKDIINYLNNVLPQCKILTIPRLWGGEPTIHPDFFSILELFKIPFGLYTNMSQSLDFYIKCLGYQLLQYYYCSLHYHAINNISNFYKKLELLHGKNVHVNVMLEDYKELETIIQYLVNNFPNFRVSIKVLDKTVDYQDNFYFDIYKKYLKEDQKYLFNNKEISRFDIVKNKINYSYDSMVIENKIVCDINSYFNKLDINGNFYTCMDEKTLTCSVYDDQKLFFNLDGRKKICSNTMCCPYLFEYGTKQKI